MIRASRTADGNRRIDTAAVRSEWTERLNELGQEGWELVGYEAGGQSGEFGFWTLEGTMKRPLPE